MLGAIHSSIGQEGVAADVHLSAAAGRLAVFVHTSNPPVADTITEKGGIACTDPLSAGLVGRYDRIASAPLPEADPLRVVGCKLSRIATERYTVPPGERITDVDIIAGETGRTAPPG